MSGTATQNVKVLRDKVYLLDNGDMVRFQPANLPDFSYRVIVSGCKPSIWVPKNVRLTSEAVTLFYMRAKHGDEAAYVWDDARRSQKHKKAAE